MKDFTKRQKEIIDTSIELIARGGIQELTIKNLSKEIGISEPAIYRHFENKTGILLAILTYFEELTQNLSEKTFSLNIPVIERMLQFFEGLTDEFLKTPSFTKVLFSEEIFQNEKELSEKVFSIMKGHQKRILELIKDGQKRREIREDIPEEIVAMIMLGSFRLLVKKWRMSEFSFDLKEQSLVLINSLKKLFVL